MEHDDDVGPVLERFEVASLLITTVAAVMPMRDDLQPQPPGNLDRVILAHIVDEDDVVDDVLREIAIGPLKCLRGIVGRHGHDNRRFLHRATC